METQAKSAFGRDLRSPGRFIAILVEILHMECLKVLNLTGQAMLIQKILLFIYLLLQSLLYLLVLSLLSQ